MTSRKQRDREKRYRRHGVDRPESPQRDEAHRVEEPEKAKGKSRGRSSSRKPVPYPTLRRALVRAPIFGIIWFVLARFVLQSGGRSIDQDVLQTLILTVVMVPLLFGAETLTYRLTLRRGLPVEDRPADGWLGFRR